MIRPLVLAAALATSFGCGGNRPSPPPDYGSEDGLKIAKLIDEFNEAKAEPAVFKKQFAGAAPANWKDYEKHAYVAVVGSAKIDGSTATTTVTVRNEVSNQPVGDLAWTFAKVGDAWKIKTAPLK